MINILRSYIKSQFGLLSIMVFLGLFWISMHMVAEAVPGTIYGRQQEVEVIQQAISSVVQPGDDVFLASQEAGIRQELERSGASIFSFNPKENSDFDALLLNWLDKRCQPQEVLRGSRSYLVWTEDEDGTIQALGNAVRSLAFFSSFEAVLPYQGVDAIAIDKVLLLQPRASLVSRYCEVKKMVDNRLVMVIVDVNKFPPLLGSFKSGNIIWLASSETRTLHREDYEVKNYPVSLQFMMWKTNWADSWSFTNLETDAYTNATNDIVNHNGLVLMDKTASLGEVPTQFLEGCPENQVEINSPTFRQICIRGTR